MVTSRTHKVWFVTGSSSGLGKAVVEHALQQGCRVVATLRKPQAISDLSTKYAASQLLVIELDVTSTSEIIAAFSKAIETFGGVDVVYNNAGYLLLGEAEATPDNDARAQFEVNFWGATNVAREAIRVFRDVNQPAGGRLLQASSKGGVLAPAGLGYYSASKFALEGMSEALSKEIQPSWNIKITLIELGAFATRAIASESMVTVPPHPAYAAPDNAAKRLRDYLGGPHVVGSNPRKAAREIFRIAEDDSVELRIPLGLDAIRSAEGKLQEFQRVVETSAQWSIDLK